MGKGTYICKQNIQCGKITGVGEKFNYINFPLSQFKHKAQSSVFGWNSIVQNISPFALM